MASMKDKQIIDRGRKKTRIKWFQSNKLSLNFLLTAKEFKTILLSTIATINHDFSIKDITLIE